MIFLIDQVFRWLACVSPFDSRWSQKSRGEKMDLKQYCTSNVACTNMTCFIASLVIHSLHRSSGTKSMRHFMLCFKLIIIVYFEATFFFLLSTKRFVEVPNFAMTVRHRARSFLKHNLRRGKSISSKTLCWSAMLFITRNSPQRGVPIAFTSNKHEL